MIVCDTGPIVAAALLDDDRHHECVELFTGLHLAGRALLVPGTIVSLKTSVTVPSRDVGDTSG